MISKQMINLVLTKFYHPRLSSMNIRLTSTAKIKPAVDVGQEMKKLNDQKRFHKALQLFDQYKNANDIKTSAGLIITQALKACAQTRDLRRGSMIHQLVSSRVKDDSYILASLIHFYSKS